ncbi:hypothetical protein GW17_00041299 [Ensete ventricosum]|nr:hypothetical protein GW17_00041299 [Ensete ventricosum]
MFSCLLCCLLCFAKGVVTQEEQQPPEMPQRLKWSETGRSPLRVPLSKPKEALSSLQIKAEEAEDVHDTNLSSDRMTFFPEETWSGSSTEMGLVASAAQSLLVGEVRLPEGTSLARRGDPATVGKINIDLVLVLVQHNGSRSGKEEEPSLHVGEKGQR